MRVHSDQEHFQGLKDVVKCLGVWLASNFRPRAISCGLEGCSEMATQGELRNACISAVINSDTTVGLLFTLIFSPAPQAILQTQTDPFMYLRHFQCLQFTACHSCTLRCILRLCDHVFCKLWHPLAVLPRLCGHTFLFTSNSEASCLKSPPARLCD